MTVIKEVAKRIVYNRLANCWLRRTLRPFQSLMPPEIIQRIPIVGIVPFPLPNHKTLYVEVNGLNICASAIAWGGIEAFEPETRPIFLTLLENAETFFDIGANIGLYALLAAIDNPTRKVYAFEPDPDVYAILRHNVDLNKLDNVHLSGSAATNFDGEITLYLRPGASASTFQGLKNVTRAISVPAITLDSFVAMNNISGVDLIKMDTETTEPAVLAGALEIINRDQPLIICEVLKGFTEAALHTILDPLNYKYFWITERGLVEKKHIEGDGTWKNQNYLFVPAQQVDRVLQ